MSELPGPALEDVDSIGRAFVAGPAGTGQPGAAWGVVAGGALVHSAGAGSAALPGDGSVHATGRCTPDAGTVFRIASMTKSFTAATVLLLRDEGALGLDDPVARWVGEVEGWRGPTSDSPPLTVRHLLTMSGGLPTDDPWGDRQQGLPAAEFGAFLRRGVRFAWAPGTAFEYSNLGYAILGRVVAAAAGGEYADVVRSRLLGPLGLSSTVFRDDEVPAERLALGYRVTDGLWERVPFDRYGAFAPMGGLFSSVADLARWVAGFLDAFPARDGDESDHPLSRATRRELQQQHRAIPPQLVSASVTAPTTLRGGAYGYGLMVEHDPVLGQIVSHSGGYPGFGSHMRWHVGSGLGVVVLANSTYAGAQLTGRRMLQALLDQRAAGLPAGAARTGLVRDALRPAAPAPGTVWPSTLAAMADVETLLLDGWDDAVAGRLFAMNVALDEPLSRRRAELDSARSRFPGLKPWPGEPPVHESPAHARWSLRGAGGRVRLEIRLSPQAEPLVQTLQVTPLPEPASAGPLAGAVQALVEAVGHEPPSWPAAVPVGSALDLDAARRSLRIAAELAGHGPSGTAVVGLPSAGDGVRTVTVPVQGDRATLLWTVELDDAHAVRAFTIAHADQGPAWTD